MIENKTGRPREFDFEVQISSGTSEGRWLLGMLLELGERVLDQVEHLPKAVLDATPADSYLSPSRIILHLVGAELRRFRAIFPSLDRQAYFEFVQASTAQELQTIDTSGVDSILLLREHLRFRRSLLESVVADEEFLSLKISDSSLVNCRDVIGHLIWHWSYHSGHIGVVTLSLGFEYEWNSKKVKVFGEP